MFLLIVGFIVGVFVGYKFPEQVDQIVQSGKKIFDDLKRVHQNVIDAAGATIRIAIGMGWRVWTCLDPGYPDDPTIYGGVVTDNTLQGDYMQYGFTVDGVRDWTVTGNVDLATHSGTPVVECNGKVASPPAGFLKHGARAQGVFQPEFEEANVELALWAIEEPAPAKLPVPPIR